MDSIKQAGAAISDKINSATAGVSKEANKEVAKDGNQNVGDRVNAGVNAVKNKFEESQHDASYEVNKQKATH